MGAVLEMVRGMFVAASATMAAAFHDCIQPPMGRRLPPNLQGRVSAAEDDCQGGLCVGMHNGPHEGGPSSYPVGNSSVGFTRVSSTMTVPQLPEKTDGICYYIWTDIFFGDMSLGRMNQFVPQLILGNASAPHGLSRQCPGPRTITATSASIPAGSFMVPTTGLICQGVAPHTIFSLKGRRAHSLG